MVFADSKKQLQQLLLQAWRKVRHHTQIEQGNIACIRQKDIAWMRVGVKKTVNQDLLQVGLKELVCEFAAVEFDSCERAERRNLFAANIFHRQHPRGCKVFDGKRHFNAIKLCEIAMQSHQIVGFQTIVEFPQNG